MQLTPSMYRAITVVALPLASLYLMWRSRRQPAYKKFWDERFAWGTFPPRTSRPRVWVHAVSLGETNAARPLIEMMLKRWPEIDVLLTHMTPTGREAGKKIVMALGPERIRQCYLPYDAPYAVEKFFRQTRPTMGVIMETEVWPNLMREAKRLDIPMVLANARESAKSQREAQKFHLVMRPAFESFSAVLAQSEEDKVRLESLGAQNVKVCGSVKFDIKPNLSQSVAAKSWRKTIGRPVLTIASTRRGEEARFARAFVAKRDKLGNALLLVVPRHPERFDEVAQVFSEAGLKVCRRSSVLSPREVPADADVLLGDSMGEMSFYCALGDMTAMGGSFEPFGSQNMIEPAMAGSPLVVGPSTFNFDKIVRDGLAARAMVQVETPEEAFDVFSGWLADENERKAAGERAEAFAQKHAGATARMMDEMESLWQTALKNRNELQTY